MNLHKMVPEDVEIADKALRDLRRLIDLKGAALPANDGAAVPLACAREAAALGETAYRHLASRLTPADRLLLANAVGASVAAALVVCARIMGGAVEHTETEHRNAAKNRIAEARRHLKTADDKREWALSQLPLHPEWSWDKWCKKAAGRFGISYPGAAKVLGPIRDKLDPKLRAANNNESPAAA